MADSFFLLKFLTLLSRSLHWIPPLVSQCLVGPARISDVLPPFQVVRIWLSRSKLWKINQPHMQWQDCYCRTPGRGSFRLSNLNPPVPHHSLPLQCPGCPYGGLDLTEGLFSYFADMSVGVLTCSWYYTDGSGNGGSTPSSSSSYTPAYTPQDTPTYSPSPTPTPTPTPNYTPTTSSTPPPPPTTSSTPTSYPPPSPTTSTTPTTSSTPTSSPPPSPTPSPSPSPTPNTNTGSDSDDGQNLSGMNSLISNYANIVEDCNDE
jgi:hypothetical protein